MTWGETSFCRAAILSVRPLHNFFSPMAPATLNNTLHEASHLICAAAWGNLYWKLDYLFIITKQGKEENHKGVVWLLVRVMQELIIPDPAYINEESLVTYTCISYVKFCFDKQDSKVYITKNVHDCQSGHTYFSSVWLPSCDKYNFLYKLVSYLREKIVCFH